MIVIFLHTLSVLLMAAGFLLVGFGIYQIRVGATALKSN